MTQRINHSQWTAARACARDRRLTRYQRVLRRARRIEAARQPFNWSAYQPLAADEDLEARDSVEAEAWANLEAEARLRRDQQQGLKPPDDEPVLHDIDSLRALWVEALAELKLKPCRRPDR